MSYEWLLQRIPTEEGAFDPCFAFSVHKSGSSLMHSMIGATCRRATIPAVTVPDLMFNAGLIDDGWMADATLLPIFQRNQIFYGFRNLPSILTRPESRIRQRRFVLLVRDPRDALVSQYFSFGRKKSSHAAPKVNAEAYMERINAVQDTEIDTYVLGAAEHLNRKLIEYRTYLNFDLGEVRRYEDIYFDKQGFLTDIFRHFEIEIDPRIVADVAREHDIRPAREDDTKHIRKGTPGDHRDKLAPQTIGKLNDIFRETGAFYGYAF